MIIYHGTTDVAAKQIAREGLIPHRESAFNTQKENVFAEMFGEDSFSGPTLREIEGDTPYVYVTHQFDVAKLFADFRARYERAEPGDILIWGNGNRMKKVEGNPTSDVLPAIIEFDVPEDIGINGDPQAFTMDAHTCRCSIPAKYVVKIHAFPFLKKTTLEEKQYEEVRPKFSKNLR